MGTVVIGVRILLAVVFALAGGAKLFDLAGSRQAVRDFGVPDRFGDAAGLLLPLAELAAALLLLFSTTAVIGALLALALLLAFIGGIANALRHGVAPACHCFGQLYSAPADNGTLVRNGVLAVLALFVVVEGGGPAIDTWLNTHSAADVVAVVGVVLAVGLASFVVQLWFEAHRLGTDLAQAQRQAAGAPPGLPVGTPAPDVVLTAIDGSPVSLEDLRGRGLPILLIFASPNCSSCVSLFPNVRRWQHTLAQRLTIAIISAGNAIDNLPLTDNYGLETVLLQENDEAITRYRIRGTPTAVLINLEGTIASLPAESVFGIEPMVRLVLREGDVATPQGSLA